MVVPAWSGVFNINRMCGYLNISYTLALFFPPKYNVMYQFYYLNILMQMLGITLSIHNNESCYICMLEQSICRTV